MLILQLGDNYGVYVNARQRHLNRNYLGF